jgi:hypothetical protein
MSKNFQIRKTKRDGKRFKQQHDSNSDLTTKTSKIQNLKLGHSLGFKVPIKVYLLAQVPKTFQILSRDTSFTSKLKILSSGPGGIVWDYAS